MLGKKTILQFVFFVGGWKKLWSINPETLKFSRANRPNTIYKAAIGGNIVNTLSFLTHFLRGETHFSPTPLFPNPTPPPDNFVHVYHFSQVCHYNPTTLDGGTGVNGTECSKWKEEVLNMEQKPFLVYNVSTIFVTYCGSKINFRGHFMFPTMSTRLSWLSWLPVIFLSRRKWILSHRRRLDTATAQPWFIIKYNCIL